ncbi:MAG: hypothetical protein AAFY82_06955 [Pseudomonadota bacterium]
MKRALLCLFLSVLPLSANASTELARQWGQEASRLSAETFDLILAVDLGEPATLSETLSLDIYRFGRTSADLARWIDGSNGPQDLGCIFRGMASESEDQLIALEQADSPLRQRDHLRRLANMFADAEIIALAAQRGAPIPSLLPAKTRSACEANLEETRRALR